MEKRRGQTGGFEGEVRAATEKLEVRLGHGVDEGSVCKCQRVSTHLDRNLTRGLLGFGRVTVHSARRCNHLLFLFEREREEFRKEHGPLDLTLLLGVCTNGGGSSMASLLPVSLRLTPNASRSVLRASPQLIVETTLSPNPESCTYIRRVDQTPLEEGDVLPWLAMAGSSRNLLTATNLSRLL